MFYCTKELFTYMKEKGRRVLSVEVASSDHSDFEVTELFLRLVKDEFAEYLKAKKRYRAKPLYLLPDGSPGPTGPAPDPADPVGQVLLPPYRLEIDEEVVFDRKRVWLFSKLVMDGIRL